MFFGKKQSKVEVVTGMPHGSHWNLVLGGDNDKEGEKKLMDVIGKTVGSGNPLEKRPAKGAEIAFIEKADSTMRAVKEHEIACIENELGDVVIRVISVNGSIWTAFPKIKDTTIEKAEIRKIHEWTNHIEAQINTKLQGPVGASLTFFATDYVKNKEKYEKESELNLKLSGLAYAIRIGGLERREVKAVDGKTYKLAPDFTTIIPTKQAPDDYQFYGKVNEIKKAKFIDEEAFVLRTRVAGSEKEELELQIGVLKNRVVGEIPRKGAMINGLFWLEGEVR